MPPATWRLYLAAALLLAHGPSLAQQGVKLTGKELFNSLPVGPAARMVVLSPDNRRCVWIEDMRSPHRAFRPQDVALDPANPFRAVIDGVAWKPYHLIDENSIVFSPDSLSLAFAACAEFPPPAGKEPPVQMWVVAYDGKEGKPYERIAGADMIFSPDSLRLAYVAATAEGQVVVLDGKETRAYEQVLPHRLAFSPDSKRLAFVARRDGKWLSAVINADGGLAEGELYEGIGNATPLFSPDSKNVAYIAVRGGKGVVVIDGREGAEHGKIAADSLRFSPDGKALAYVVTEEARGKTESFVVASDKPGKRYDAVLAPTLAFSPDGSQVAFAARRGEAIFVAVSGKELGPYHGVALRPVVFSATGRRFAFTAKRIEGRVERWFVVSDGVEGKAYERISSDPVFSPDERRAAYIADGRLVVNGTEARVYRAVRGPPVFSADGTRVAYAAMAIDQVHEELAWNGPGGQRRKVLFNSPATFQHNRMEIFKVEETIEDESPGERPPVR